MSKLKIHLVIGALGRLCGAPELVTACKWNRILVEEVTGYISQVTCTNAVLRAHRKG